MRRLDEPGENYMSELEQSSRPYVVYLMQPQPSAGHQDQHLVLKASVPHEYNDLSETCGKSQLCRPSARTEKAIDALLQPATGFQITCSRCHPLDGSGIRAWMDCLQNRQAARMIFCVPTDLFSSYKAQNTDNLDVHKYPFQQYVMGIDLRFTEKSEHVEQLGGCTDVVCVPQ